VGLSVAIISIVIGLAIGLAAGYYRKFDASIMRVMDGMMAIPAILLAIALVSLNRGQRRHRHRRDRHPRDPARGAAGALGGTDDARAALYRGGDRAAAAGTGSCIGRHILPNTIAPLVVQATYITASAILTEAALSVPRRRACRRRSRPGAT
jgi:peptide/nickel transport system permease protein